MSAITATAQATGLAVDLNLDAALPTFLNLLAAAFDDDPEYLAGLLHDLAQVRRELHRAQEQAEALDIPDVVASSLGAQADRLHEELTDQLGEHVTASLTHRQAVALQEQLLTCTESTLVGRLGRAS